MEAEPPLYPVAGAVGPQGDLDRLGVPEGPEAPLDELVGAYPNYNEEEEERRYYRRKRLCVLKNVVAASAGGMLTYGVYLGLLQMQLILHYDETYREVKYGNMGLPDIDSKMLIGINVTPIAALLYTPVLIRFFGTKWMMFLAVGIYALFVSTNYWERYYTLVPSAIALGVAIVPLWASMGNYITRMAQKYYEYSHYKEQDEQGPRRRPPRGSHAPYLLVFQAIFYSVFHLSFACAQLPMVYFLNHYLYDMNHTLYNVQNCGTNSHGILSGFNKTVLRTLPRSRNLIVVESVLMAVAFIAMLLVLGLCGAAYRPTEEIDLRSVGWGNIFQLPFKHVRDFRLRHLVPFFIYSGFEVLFACTTTLWGVGSALNKTGLGTLLGILYEDKERQDFIFTIYHWWQAMAIFMVYLGLGLPMKVKLVVLLVTLVGAATSYLWMERKLQQGVVPRLPRIPRPQHKVRGYRYLEEDNSDESDAEGERGGGRRDGAEEEAPHGGPGLGLEPAGQPRRPCPYEQALGGDGPEEQ
ncbi:protein unc-93 homolog B1 isoform X2 [Choloepus didactylus]|uniref:protein unc-93 homolog B1 isoform X2 n=1 Tax=Choloepus didactylus TaxID=27675 RepID=UPI00189C6C9E|nr:protein unc-93 homolog B1 isoform X2 [Choloepus didactylus]